jgi:hypothetical protein
VGGSVMSWFEVGLRLDFGWFSLFCPLSHDKI